MSAVIIIPARYASTRYPGKPLAALRGADGQSRSLIQRSWDAAAKVCGIDRVVVATDDDRIRDAVEAFGGEVVMTSEACRNGTERCAEALKAMGGNPDIVVNLQGDAPLTPAWFIEDLIADLTANPQAQVATPVLRCEGQMRAALIADRHAGRVGGTTAVFDTARRGLYFSKEVIPFCAKEYAPNDPTPVFHHVGVYAYRPQALGAYTGWPEGELERLEGLEQLRFIENGTPVLCTQVEARGCQFWELNNPEDIPVIEKMMSDMGWP